MRGTVGGGVSLEVAVGDQHARRSDSTDGNAVDEGSCPPTSGLIFAGI